LAAAQVMSSSKFNSELHEAEKAEKKDLLMRKIHMMKHMLRNEKRASQLINNQIGSLTKDILLKDVT
jgi:hypothetical protein